MYHVFGKQEVDNQQVWKWVTPYNALTLSLLQNINNLWFVVVEKTVTKNFVYVCYIEKIMYLANRKQITNGSENLSNVTIHQPKA